MHDHRPWSNYNEEMLYTFQVKSDRLEAVISHQADCRAVAIAGAKIYAHSTPTYIVIYIKKSDHIFLLIK